MIITLLDTHTRATIASVVVVDIAICKANAKSAIAAIATNSGTTTVR